MGGDVRFGRKLVLPALFLGMTLVMLRPNPSELANRLPGNTGDPALITWTLSWGAHTLPTHPTQLDPAVELDQAQDAATVCCDMCPHPLDQHDAIARRFCTATSAGALSRGCICTGS